MKPDPIPLAVSQDYEANRGNLVRYVDEAMISDKNILELIGTDGIELMKTDHLNHAALMSYVLLLNRYSVLDDVIPREYRVKHTNGFSYDYFPVVYNYWIAAVEQYLKKENTEPVINVYRQLIENHRLYITLSLKTVPRVYPVADKWRKTGEMFFEALLNSDTYSCSEIAHNSCKNPSDIMEFYINVAQPALYRIGDSWENCELSVAFEHLSTAIVTRIIYQMSGTVKPAFNNGRKVMVLSITGEHHQLGALMVANCFEMYGWEVNFLSDNVPLRDAMLHIAEFKPQLMVISVTMLYNIQAFADLIDRIKTVDYMKEIKIIAGGQAFKYFTDLPLILGADAYADNCINAVKKAENILLK